MFVLNLNWATGESEIETHTLESLKTRLDSLDCDRQLYRSDFDGRCVNFTFGPSGCVRSHGSFEGAIEAPYEEATAFAGESVVE